jgi:transposase InsO family protein
MDDNQKNAYLTNLYYKEHRTNGRDALFHYISKTLGNKDISRRYIAGWLAKQKVNQIYTRKKPQTNIRPIITSKPGAFLQIDLIDFSNKPSAQNYRYILNVIDVFSRKVWLAPLKKKTSQAVDTALSKILTDILENFTISVIQSDNGTEFTGNVFEKFNIKHTTSRSYTPAQQGMVEKSNLILKRILTKILYIENKRDWNKYLLEIQNIYNTTLHTGIKSTPDELYFGTDDEHLSNYELQKNGKAKAYKDIDTVLPVETKVRILIEKKGAIDKGGPSYSDEIYAVVRVIKGNAKAFTITRYKLASQEGILQKNTFALSKLLVIPSEK